MADLLERCSVCQALLDEEDLFCSNCGTEAPHRAESPDNSTHLLTHNFQCDGCGAAMSYDASAKNLRCPFCGSERLTPQNDAKALAPSRVIPFQIQQNEANEILRKWMGASFWRPSDLVQSAVVTKMTPVYVPYWIFRAKTFTYWNADSSHTPPGAKASWYPTHGEHRSSYAGLLVGASAALTPQETSALCPFDLQKGVPLEKLDLTSVVYEPFTLQRKYARPLAQQLIDSLENQACRQFVPGNCRNLKLNVLLEGLSSEPVLLPVWIMAYRYRDQVFRFLINGQTGKAFGQAPFDWKKILIPLAIAGGILLVVALVFAVIAALSAT
jgi:predicted RNA-binding Zn-ribbon protein involved in translation (DUF1610 family)